MFMLRNEYISTIFLTEIALLSSSDVAVEKRSREIVSDRK